MSQGREMHDLQAIDILGIAVAGSLVASPSWYAHMLDWMPAPTAVYTLLGSVFIFCKILDMVGLLPRFGRKDRPDKN